MSGKSTLLDSPTPTAREILDAGAVVTHFQPIYSAKQKSVIGVEALSRGLNPITSQLVSPLQLFRMAEAEQLNVDMEELCRDTALRTFADLREQTVSNPRGHESDAAACARENLILFLNFDANSASAPTIDGGSGLLFLNFDASVERNIEPAAAILMEKVRRVGLDPRGVAIEILESQFEDLDRLKHLAQSLHECGFLLVLDDVRRRPFESRPDSDHSPRRSED